MNPPPSISILWCPVCGRDDRFTPFTGKTHFTQGTRHFTQGTRCAGKPIRVVYNADLLGLALRRSAHDVPA